MSAIISWTLPGGSELVVNFESAESGRAFGTTFKLSAETPTSDT
jgi:hypothetical protein